MADRVWNGGTSNDFATAANWTPTNVPVAGDTLYFLSSTDNACSTGMDRQAISAAINFPLVVVGPLYDHDLGSAANPLIAGIDKLIWEGTGTGFFQANTANTPDLPIDDIIQKNGRLILNLTGTDVQTTLIRLIKGFMELSDGRVTTVEVLGRSTGDASLRILAALDLLTNLNINHGDVITSLATHDKITLNRGTLTLIDSAAVTTGGAKITNKSGVVHYNSDGNITSVEQRSGGRFFVSGNFKSGTMTITNFDFFGGLLDLRNTAGNVAITNLVWHNDRNTIQIPAGKTITIS